LVHAADPDDGNFRPSLAFLTTLQSSSTILRIHPCVNEVGSFIDSLIFAEYEAKVSFGSAPDSTLAYLASQSRVRPVPKRPPEGTRTQIRLRVRDKRDCTFAEVASESDSRVLVSHDWEHSPESTRKWFLATLRVTFAEAPAGSALLV
jgi:hypothetical protein